MAKTRYTRLVFINLLVFVLLVALMETLLTAYYDMKDQQAKAQGIGNARSAMACYDSLDWAEQYWIEHGEVSSRYKSYVGWIGNPFHGKAIQVSVEGFRRTVPANNADNCPQIAFLGGSTMWGYGVDDAHTIPSLFAELNDSVNVKNMGQLAYCAYQSLALLQLEINKGYKPELVISYDGANETPEVKEYFQHTREQQFQERIKGADRGILEPEVRSFYGFKRLGTALRNALEPSPENIANEAFYSDEQNHLAAKELLQSWLLMKKLCEANGIQFFCVLQPQMHVGNPDLQYLKESKFKQFASRSDAYVQYYSHVYELMETEAFLELKEHFIDLTQALNGHSGMYIDICHLAPGGNEVIANYINNWLGQNWK